MNIPLGQKKIDGKKLSSDAILADINEFLETRKNGYFCVTVQGQTGLEEGLLVIESSHVLGAHYDYMRYGKEFTAGEGMKRVVNAFFAKKGVYDAFVLTSQQLELLKIFNEKILMLEPMNQQSFQGGIPVSFSPDFEKAVVQEQLDALSRDDVLKQRGIGDVKVDNLDTVEKQLQVPVPKPVMSDKVAEEVKKYMTTGKEPVEEVVQKPVTTPKPTEVPKPPAAEVPKPPAAEVPKPPAAEVPKPPAAEAPKPAEMPKPKVEEVSVAKQEKSEFEQKVGGTEADVLSQLDTQAERLKKMLE